MNDPQARIQKLLDRLASEGTERGLQVSAWFEGRLVIDAASGAGVNEDTLFPVFSVSKGIAATIAHQLVERGILNYDQPIAEVWPEFAANGKSEVTLRHALSHTAGIPNIPAGFGFAEFSNWETMCATVADMTPLWTPGTQSHYHAITYGWIVGETARRATGQPSFQELLREEIGAPLGVEKSLFIGLPDGFDQSQVIDLEEDTSGSPPPDTFVPQPIPTWLGPLYAWMNRTDLRRACLPASSGIMSARAIAKHYAALLPGGADGVELLPSSRVRKAVEWQKLTGPEGGFSNFLLGYAPKGERESPGAPVKVFGHGGYGGSIGFADLEKRLAVGLTKNRFHPENTTGLIIDEVRKSLGA